MLSGLIFDLDGCLIDSKEVQKKAFFNSYKIVCGDNNCPSYREYIKYTGNSIDNVFRQMGLPAEMAFFYRKISRESVAEVSVNWEAIKFIEYCREMGLKISICTGKDHDRTEELLNYHGILHLFDALVCADDVEYPKPSAEPILEAMKMMNIQSQESVIMIGDGYNDILSAKNAGIRSVLTLWYGDEGVQREADYMVMSVEELKGIVEFLIEKEVG